MRKQVNKLSMVVGYDQSERFRPGGSRFPIQVQNIYQAES